jgi:hypothetical protein
MLSACSNNVQRRGLCQACLVTLPKHGRDNSRERIGKYKKQTNEFGICVCHFSQDPACAQKAPAWATPVKRPTLALHVANGETR